jgi:predicted RNA binding protein YcfA (HicA-like mRNA interferase family)
MVSQKGGHVKFGKRTPEGYFVVVVPRHDVIAVGTLRSILRHCRMSWEEFDRL